MSPKTLFEKFGHHCEVQSGLRDLPMFKTSKDFGVRFKRFMKRFRMINETNKRGYNFLRSQKKIENEYRKQLLYPYTIHPFSDFKKFWEIFMAIIILSQVVTIPLDLAGYASTYPDRFVQKRYFIYMRVIPDLFSLIDVGLNFFSGYCDNKTSTVILDPKKIFTHYLMSNFVLDTFSAIPFGVIFNRYYERTLYMQYWHFFFHYCGLFKLCRYTQFLTYCSNFAETCETSYIFHRVILAIITFILYIHVITCCCLGIMAYEFPYYNKLLATDRFIFVYSIEASSFSVVYTKFFYCSCLLILNSGYAVSPISDATIMFVVYNWLSARIFYIITIAYFLELHIAMHSSTQKYVDMVSEIKDFLKHRQVPTFLQKRILSYYDIKYQSSYFQESEILNTVSGQLRQEIIMNSCGKLVENVTFFKNLPMALLIRIVSCLRYEIFLTNDLISKAGTTGDCMHFISSGTVAVYTKFGSEICHLHDGDYFGEIAMVMKDTTRVASVVAAEVCELYRLDRKDFIRAIIPYPDLYDRITYVAGDRMERTDIIDEAQKNTKQAKISET